MKKKLIKGSLFTIGASLWWGVIGVFYFKFVSFASPLELTIHRTVWTALLLVISLNYYSKWPEFNKIIRKPKNIFIFFIISFLEYSRSTSFPLLTIMFKQLPFNFEFLNDLG